MGQRALQSSTDVMLGWTQIGDKPHFVRQMKNMKGSIPVEWLSGRTFNFYVWACWSHTRPRPCALHRCRSLPATAATHPSSTMLSPIGRKRMATRPFWITRRSSML